MDYQQELINLITGVTDIRVLAFVYGTIDELVEHANQVLSGQNQDD